MEVPEPKPKKVRRSCFMSHLADLPLVKSATVDAQTLYSEAKERSLLFRAWASMAELVLILTIWGADKTVGTLYRAVLRHEEEAQLAAAIDTYACVKLQQLESKFPVLTKSSAVVMKKTSHRVLSVVFTVPRWLLNTGLGKLAVLGLEKTLQLSVTVADLLQPDTETAEGEPGTAESTSSATEKSTAAPDPDVTALLTAVVQSTAGCAHGLFPTLYNWFILTPLFIWLTVLSWTRQAVRYVRRRSRHPSRRRSHRLAAKADPETRAKISSRRRMSPRKRIPSLTEAVAQCIPEKALSMLGMQVKLPLPEPGIEDLRGSPNMEEGEKRKLSAVEDEENMVVMVPEDYRSDEDPDYLSESSSTTDSYEYISSATEGDSEEEEAAEEAGEEQQQQEEVEAKDSGVGSNITTPTGSGSPESNNKRSSMEPPRPADNAAEDPKVSEISPADSSSQPSATSAELVSQE